MRVPGRSLVTAALLALGLVLPHPAAAGASFSFRIHSAPIVVPGPVFGGYGGYGAPVYGAPYGPPVYYGPPAAYYPPPYYAFPPPPYGYPIGYRGAWRTDYPWWSPGPRGYRWR